MPLVAALDAEGQKKALLLYKEGLSAQQVADHLGVSIDAVYYTLRKHKVARRTVTESNKIRFDRKGLSYQILENLTPVQEELKLAALMLYWAEGYKVGKNVVDFANSDPDMAVIFKRFLVEVCQVDITRIRASLYCYQGQDIEELHIFWSKLLGIPRTQFIKPYIKESAPGPRGPRMIHGLVHVRYCDTKLLRQILTWIDGYRAILKK